MVGRSRPPIRWSRVDLPLPEGPTSATRSRANDAAGGGDQRPDRRCRPAGIAAPRVGDLDQSAQPSTTLPSRSWTTRSARSRHGPAVRGDQRGAATVAAIREQRQDLRLGLGVDLARRLVGEQDLRARPPGPPPARRAPPRRPRAGRGGRGDGPRARRDRAAGRAAARRGLRASRICRRTLSPATDARRGCRTAAGCRSRRRAGARGPLRGAGSGARPSARRGRRRARRARRGRPSSVDLPLPEGPITATVSPASTCRLTPRSASVSSSPAW